MNKRKRSLLWLFWVCIPLALVLLAALAGGVGYYLYFNSQYEQAVFSVDTGEFADARGSLERVPAFYKDSAKLMLYAQAGEALAAGDCRNARLFYGRLGGYRDSREQLLEVDYREATETLGQGDYGPALGQLAALGDYKDARKKIDEACAEILKQARDEYKHWNYGKARGRLALLSGQKKHDDTVKKFLTLIEAHEKTVEEGLHDYNTMKALYRKLVELGDYEDAEDLLVSNPFILYRLEGVWRYGSTEYTMTFRFDYGQKAWFHDEARIDGEAVRIDSQVESYRNDYGSWYDALRFELLAEDRMEVTWLYGGSKDDSFIYDREK